MRNISKFSAIALLSACVPTLPTHESQAPRFEFSAAFIDEMRCEGRPNPAPVLQDLVEAGIIDRSARMVVDSVSCFPTIGAPSLMGMPIVAICGYEEDMQKWGRYSDLFSRGPGTSPGQLISIHTSFSKEATRSWYGRSFGSPNGGVRFGAPYFSFGGATEVTCRDQYR